jgi:hypothetical protein
MEGTLAAAEQAQKQEPPHWLAELLQAEPCEVARHYEHRRIGASVAQGSFRNTGPALRPVA